MKLLNIEPSSSHGDSLPRAMKLLSSSQPCFTSSSHTSSISSSQLHLELQPSIYIEPVPRATLSFTRRAPCSTPLLEPTTFSSNTSSHLVTFSSSHIQAFTSSQLTLMSSHQDKFWSSRQSTITSSPTLFIITKPTSSQLHTNTPRQSPPRANIFACHRAFIEPLLRSSCSSPKQQTHRAKS